LKLWKFGYNFGSTIRVPTGSEQMTKSGRCVEWAVGHPE
jgi:hypothetical protein